MMGYPTHFGQMEAMKLVASPKFAEKRIGYLALMVLLDESQDVLLLVTNTLKNDFANKNQYVAGLALCALGNISSADIARDLSKEVSAFFKSHHAYLRKKAALCAVRIIRKVPSLVEDFADGVVHLLTDKNHAVQLTAITLMIEMAKVDPSVIPAFRQQAPRLVSMLRTLWLAGYVSEYDVNGVMDPFLQTRILELMRVVAAGDQKTSELLIEILAQVAINTESSSNAGNSVLYECVQTIMGIEAEGGLRLLGVNLLGKFLTNRENNIRYVALATLAKVVTRDADAIQRHRNVIVDCLKDPDVSIRRRALDLIYALVTKANAKALVKELLNYLGMTSGDQEFKADLTEKICNVVERFALSRRWHIDTVISVLCAAGNFTRDNVSVDLISLISRTKDLQAYSAHHLYQTLTANPRAREQMPLVAVALWAVGEYGEFLASADGARQASVDEGSPAFVAVAPQTVVQEVEAVLQLPTVTTAVKQTGLTALVKLAQRFNAGANAPLLEQIRRIIRGFASSISVELQQRATEYGELLSPRLDAVRAKIVGRMPQYERAKKRFGQGASASANAAAAAAAAAAAPGTNPEGNEEEDEDADEDEEEEEVEGAARPAAAGGKATAPPAVAKTTNVLDLLGGLGGAAAPAPAAPAAGARAGAGAGPVAAPAASSADVLLNLMGGGFGVPAPSPAAVKAPAGTMDIMSMFDGGFGGAPGAGAVAGAGAGGFGAAGLFPGAVAPGAGAVPSAMGGMGMFGMGDLPRIADPFGMGGFPSAATTVLPAPAPAMGGVFGSPVSAFPSAVASPASAAAAASPAAAGAAGAGGFPDEVVFDARGVTITFSYAVSGGNTVTVTLRAANANGSDVSDFDFQAAVPPHIKKVMRPASSKTIPAYTLVTSPAAIRQELVLVNEEAGKKKTLLKAKVIFSLAGEQVTEVVTINKFPTLSG